MYRTWIEIQISDSATFNIHTCTDFKFIEVEFKFFTTSLEELEERWDLWAQHFIPSCLFLCNLPRCLSAKWCYGHYLLLPSVLPELLTVQSAQVDSQEKILASYFGLAAIYSLDCILTTCFSPRLA